MGLFGQGWKKTLGVVGAGLQDVGASLNHQPTGYLNNYQDRQRQFEAEDTRRTAARGIGRAMYGGENENPYDDPMTFGKAAEFLLGGYAGLNRRRSLKIAAQNYDSAREVGDALRPSPPMLPDARPGQGPMDRIAQLAQGVGGEEGGFAGAISPLPYQDRMTQARAGLARYVAAGGDPEPWLKLNPDLGSFYERGSLGEIVRFDGGNPTIVHKAPKIMGVPNYDGSQSIMSIDPFADYPDASGGGAPVDGPSDMPTVPLPQTVGGGTGDLRMTAPAGSRAARLNNPGNLRWDGRSQWQGMTGRDSGGFVQFDSPENGIRAARINLQNQQRLHGLNTLSDIITKYAPASDNNDTRAYIANVARMTGLDPNAPLNLQDPATANSILDAMFSVEGGGTPSRVQPPRLAGASPSSYTGSTGGLSALPSNIPRKGEFNQSSSGPRVLFRSEGYTSDALGGNAGGVTPEAIDSAAKLFNETGQMPSIGQGKQGTAIRQAILNRAAELGNGATPGQDRRESAESRYLRNDESGFRDRFEGDQEVKRYNTIATAYQTISALSKDETGASDIALIFSLMKMYDPDTGVREGEYANASQAAGVPDRIVNAYNKAVNGQSLNPKMRQEFAAAAGQVHNVSRNRYDERVEQFRGIAKDYGYNADRAVPVRTNPSGRRAQPPSLIKGMTAAQEATQRTYVGKSGGARVGTQQNPYVPTSAAQYNGIPKDAYYIGQDGSIRQKGGR